ncbi:MAG: hypothetical protein V1933_05510 [Candidatus Omnitrophota bacterium]
MRSSSVILILTVVLAFILIGGVNCAQAGESDSAQVIVFAKVESRFTMDVSTSAVDFGSIKQGSLASSDKEISLTCYSNTGNTWEVSVCAAPLINTEGTSTIPSDPNFEVYGATVSEPENFSGGTNHVCSAIPFPAAAKVFYTSAPNSRGSVTYNLKLPSLKVPLDQEVGLYQATIYLTMAEI